LIWEKIFFEIEKEISKMEKRHSKFKTKNKVYVSNDTFAAFEILVTQKRKSRGGVMRCYNRKSSYWKPIPKSSFQIIRLSKIKCSI